MAVSSVSSKLSWRGMAAGAACTCNMLKLIENVSVTVYRKAQDA